MGASQRFESGPGRVALIELYTSEGCSSCPPAERWLGDLRQTPGLWRDFVPVAFHVNYWDHLGWKDVLADKTFTARQHAYADLWRASSVYTPGFVLNGAEWRPRGSAPSRSSTNDAGKLTAVWEAGSQRCRIIYVPSVTTQKTPNAAKGFDVFVALLGGEIMQDVRKGENAGRRLRHDFVALRLEKAALDASSSSGEWSATITLAPWHDVKPQQLGLAAWVSRSGELEPLQSTGGWIEPVSGAAGL
jgi:hypothetical protein